MDAVSVVAVVPVVLLSKVDAAVINLSMHYRQAKFSSRSPQDVCHRVRVRVSAMCTLGAGPLP